MSTSLVWFRRDLRLADHHALSEAGWSGGVVPVFVVDPAFDRSGPNRRAFLLDSVAALAASIAERGGSLVIRHGNPAQVIPAMAAEVGADRVFVTRDASPFGRARDALVAERLEAIGRSLVAVDSNSAVRPGAIVKDDGEPYAVFTAYHRRWAQQVMTETVEPPDDMRWATADTEGVKALLLTGPSVTNRLPHPAASERGAWRVWGEFISGGLSPIDTYDRDRDRPDLDATSHLSAAIKVGLIHPRQLIAQLDPSSAGQAAWERQLAWRDFYADVVWHRPDSVWRNLNPAYDQMRVDSGAGAVARFERWCTGTTGFPLVDAGMRQLVQTGWVHNRVRMVAASFLVKDLHLPWVWGARYFMRHLIDGDLASNNHGWQWVAGSGTDAAPYFRVFNPTAQADKFDPDGAYVERWIPELGTSQYPAPMVDHAAERIEALARYEVMKSREPDNNRSISEQPKSERT